MGLKEQLELVRTCYDKVMSAQNDWNAYRRAAGEGGVATPELAFVPIIVALTHVSESISAKVEERKRRFDAVPVLQALLRFKDGTTRKVAVSKPSGEIEEPYIGEMFHDALVKQGVVASLEDYPILVVDKRRRIVGEIPTK